jgi:excisionase family DNA binding protein
MKRGREKIADHLLTVREAGEILRLHPRTVMNMARRGELPGCKIGKQWRFARRAVENWLSLRLGDAEPLGNDATGAKDTAIPETVRGMLNGKSVKVLEELGSPDETLEELAMLICRQDETPRYRAVLDVLREREEMCSTAMDGGIAFPHPRHPLSSLSAPLLTILVVRQGVDYGAPDGKPTYVFVCSCSNSDVAHLRMIAKLVHLFRNHGIVDSLRICHNAADVVRQLERVESEMELVSSEMEAEPVT